jgi:NADPH:quinone reductase-like Zn-dependent oxidoreductase
MNSEANSAIIASAGKFNIKEIPFPEPKYNEALIEVKAVSLNRGELRAAFSKKDEWIPGWDLTGVVKQAAQDKTGPPVGTRVVGFLPNSGGWAQYVCVNTNAIAALPDNVTDAQASTLPVAGLTALHILAKGAPLLGKRVLVAGATGGVGMFALQLGALSGAYISAEIRNADDENFVKDLGAKEVIIEKQIDLSSLVPFDLILDSIGGEALTNHLMLLAQGGTCISFGNSSDSEETRFNVTAMYRSGAKLYGFLLFNELKQEPPSVGLARLVNLISIGKIKPVIELEVDWKEIQNVAEQLMQRKFKGKAVLHF